MWLVGKEMRMQGKRVRIGVVVALTTVSKVQLYLFIATLCLYLVNPL